MLLNVQLDRGMQRNRGSGAGINVALGGQSAGLLDRWLAFDNRNLQIDVRCRGGLQLVPMGLALPTEEGARGKLLYL